MIRWDVFISHASEDRAAVARRLADILAASGITAWLDEAEVKLGDNLREKIDEGLNHSQFGIVILSPHFFAKRWPKSELEGLFARETDGRKVILPIWHEVSADLVRSFSPMLAGRFAINTNQGLGEVAKQIIRAIGASSRERATARPTFAGKLTRKVLQSLPTGSVLITNIVNPDLTPRFVEELGIPSIREELWNRLRAANVPGSRVYVFEDMAHLRRHMASRHDWMPDKLRHAEPHNIAMEPTADLD